MVAVLGILIPATSGAESAPGGGADSTRTVYVSTGDHGELSFSDRAAPDARAVELEVTPGADDALAEMERRIEQNLTVANALEQSRVAREKARADARAELAAAEARSAPPVVYRDRYVDYPYVFRPPYRRHHGRWQGDGDGSWSGGRPDRGAGEAPPREPVRSRPFPYDPD